ncbi:uncharacterized protein LOC121727186 [Aricia agestis]|uniref:uncharacterized protein LOC121727186 n=1 Tax=Aricia agestis TaxID=91739 RepID=UPI001C2085D4|nr:uncharacterized protein LOC121727186 [Aricia agestis]
MIMTRTSFIAFVFLLLWQTPNVKCTDDLTTESESDLYMPIKPIEDFELETQISAECKKLGICDHVHHYPEATIEDIIRNLTEKAYAKTFYTEECRFMNMDNAFEHIKPLCKYRSGCFTPKAVKSHTGTWYLVLNTKESPLQVFTGQA